MGHSGENNEDGGDVTVLDENPEVVEEPAEVELAGLLAYGPRAGDRAGGLSFLALLVVLAGCVHFYVTGAGQESFAGRLETDLLVHAELSMASAEGEGRLAVVPAWPLRLYQALRRDLALYGFMLAVAAYLWGLSARARARRDTFLSYEKCAAELASLRQRLERLEAGGGGPLPDRGQSDTSGSAPGRGRAEPEDA